MIPIHSSACSVMFLIVASPRDLVARIFNAYCCREVPVYLDVWLIDRSIQMSKKTGALCSRGPWVFSDCSIPASLSGAGIFSMVEARRRGKEKASFVCVRGLPLGKIDLRCAATKLPRCFIVGARAHLGARGNIDELARSEA